MMIGTGSLLVLGGVPLLERDSCPFFARRQERIIY